MEVMNVPHSRSRISLAPSKPRSNSRMRSGMGGELRPAPTNYQCDGRRGCKKTGGASYMDYVARAGKFIAPYAKDLAVKASEKVLDFGKEQLLALLERKLEDLSKSKKKGGGQGEMVRIPVSMSAAQKRKMKKGGAVTITPAMISEKADEIIELLPASAKKVIKSVLNDKGVRHALQMGESMMKSGGGPIEDLIRSAKKTFAPVVEKAKQTFTPDLGRSIAKVLINEAVPALIQTATSSAVGGVTGNPYLGMVAGQTAGKYAGEKARDAINKRAGFGMKKVPIRRGLVKVGKGTRLIDQQFSVKDVGNFVTKEVPAAFGGDIMSNPIGTIQSIIPKVTVGFGHKRGGSSGYEIDYNKVLKRKTDPLYAELRRRGIVGGSMYPAGGSIYPAGKSGGMMGSDTDMPIQLGSPYINTNSPANNPFQPTHSQLGGYNKIK